MIIHEQKSRAGLGVVLNTEFDERRLIPAYAGLPDQMLKNTVFAKLGEYFELSILQTIERRSGRILQRESSPLEDHQVIELLALTGYCAGYNCIDALRNGAGNHLCEFV